MTSADAILHTERKQRSADVMFEVCHAGYHRDRVLETIVQTKLTVLDQPPRLNDAVVRSLFSAEGYGKDCTILAQHLEGVARFAYIPECKDILPMPSSICKDAQGQAGGHSESSDAAAFQASPQRHFHGIRAHLVALLVHLDYAFYLDAYFLFWPNVLADSIVLLSAHERTLG